MAKKKKIKAKEVKVKTRVNLIGGLAFIIGVILALVVGVIGSTSDSVLVIILVVLGLIVGILNITAKEAMPFLLISTALVIVFSLGGSFLDSIPVLQRILSAVIVFIVPAVLVVSIRAVFALARR